MSIEDQLFLQSIGLNKETNINRARKKERKRLAGEIPKTVREYADENDIPYSQALQDLKTVGLGKLVSKKGQKALLKEKVDESIDEMVFDPMGDVLGSGSSGSGSVLDKLDEPKTALEETEEGIEAYKTMLGDDDLYNQINKRNRDIALQNQMQYMATEPIRQAFANRAAESAAQRGLRIRAAKEAMPSNIQNIMLSKQAQAATASSAEAERARAAADQQDAATRFAGLGMQRRFG